MAKHQNFDYFFSDEPQYKTTIGRAWLASYLTALRNIPNANRKRYAVKRLGKGRFTVQNRYPNSPTAVIQAQGVA